MAENVFVLEREVASVPLGGGSILSGRLVVIHGKRCLDVRIFVTAPDGTPSIPTRRGLSLLADRAGDLAAVANAIAEAVASPPTSPASPTSPTPPAPSPV